MRQAPISIESVLSAHGDASKPLWLTEVGAPTSGPGGVGMTGQTQELTQAIDDAKASRWIGALYLYTYEDSGKDRFGLLNVHGSPKPAFAAVGAALKE
jgi:exo-beta-1,3-glucanase (GH17 family)